jgi:hypothetical protein
MPKALITLKPLVVRIATVLCIVGILCVTESRGKNMNAENYFSNQQMSAYHLAQQGETDPLMQMVRAGVDLNRPGRQDLTLLAFAVLTADHRAIVTLMRAGANPNQVIPDAGSPAILAISKHFNPRHAGLFQQAQMLRQVENRVIQHFLPLNPESEEATLP